MPFILLSSKLNTSTENALDEVRKKYPYADPNLFICTPSTKDLATPAAGIAENIEDSAADIENSMDTRNLTSEEEVVEGDVRRTCEKKDTTENKNQRKVNEPEEDSFAENKSCTYESKERIALIKTEGYRKTYAMIINTNLSHKALTDWCDQASQYDISEYIEHSSSRLANSFFAWAPCCSTVICCASDLVCDDQLLLELGIKKDDVYVIFSPKTDCNLDESAGDVNLRSILLKCDGREFETGFIFKTNAPHNILTSWCERFPRCLRKNPDRS